MEEKTTVRDKIKKKEWGGEWLTLDFIMGLWLVTPCGD